MSVARYGAQIQKSPFPSFLAQYCGFVSPSYGSGNQGVASYQKTCVVFIEQKNGVAFKF